MFWALGLRESKQRDKVSGFDLSNLRLMGLSFWFRVMAAEWRVGSDYWI